MTTFKIPTRLAVSLVVLTACMFTSIHAVENAPCYYPTGEFALGFYPCQAFDAPVSSCCPAGWTCFSNSLCIATTNSNSFPNLTLGAVQRGACTDPKWNNNICGGACLDKANADGKLAACGDDRFCCSNDFNTGQCNCEGDQGSKKVLTISPGLPQTIIQVDDTTFVGAPSISIASTRTSLPATSSTQPSSATDSPTATSGQSPSSTKSSPTSIATGGSQTQGEDSGSSNKGKIIGIAVGASVGGALVLGLLILLYLRWYKPRRAAAAAAAAQNVQPGPFSDDMAPAEDHPNGPSLGPRYNTSGYAQGGI